MNAAVVGGIAGALAAGFALWFSCRYAWWRRPVDYRHPRILMYHMIRDHRPGGRFNKLRVPASAFERQLAWLADNGWHFAFLSELAGPVAPKTVAITFDDGYRDNCLAAHPLLVKYRAKATLFLVVDRFDRDWSSAKKAHHDGGELAAEEKLADEEVQEMLASGVWELGAHTLTHALLPSLDATSLEQEVAGSKAALARKFGVDVKTFAYPFGIFDERDVALARKAGYALAVTTEPRISTDVAADALLLPRLKVSGKEGMLGFRVRLRTGRRGIG